MKKAGAGRVQAVAGSIDALDKIIRQSNLTDSFDDTLVLRTSPVAVLVSKKSSQIALAPKIKQVFDGIVADGTAKKIYEKWMR